MRTDLTYVILRFGSDEPIGYIRSVGCPSPEDMADHLAVVGGFDDRDHFLHVNPGLSLAAVPLQ